jgi:hypothetical protein
MSSLQVLGQQKLQERFKERQLTPMTERVSAVLSENAWAMLGVMGSRPRHVASVFEECSVNNDGKYSHPTALCSLILQDRNMHSAKPHTA